ncbi:MAG TPA: mannose-6-phosphate isomerase, class I, partial [Oligoflexia bacterium]|nr:mannose-6-phosphate isomerase, class I [Oligoflexia bacterium]
MANWSAEPTKLLCPVKHSYWGRRFADSIIPRLAACGTKDENLPYAELWIGAHPTAPAFAVYGDEPVSLDVLIAEHPHDILGKVVCDRFGFELPFLLKVLSINRPLSIQAHPDPVLAEKLHAAQPEYFPDPRHKPELALAISPVSMLYGFRPLGAIKAAVESNPELAGLLSVQTLERLKSEEDAPALIAEVYREVMTRSSERVAESCRRLYDRLREKTQRTNEEEWILRLAAEYPEGDVGLFSFFLLNIYRLEPGQAIFVGDNVLHAYLEGELLECMTNSDNVVRGGLTNKRCDTNTLLEMLDFARGEPSLVSPVASASPGFVSFSVPAAEFCLERLD